MKIKMTTKDASIKVVFVMSFLFPALAVLGLLSGCLTQAGKSAVSGPGVESIAPAEDAADGGAPSGEAFLPGDVTASRPPTLPSGEPVMGVDPTDTGLAGVRGEVAVEVSCVNAEERTARVRLSGVIKGLGGRFSPDLRPAFRLFNDYETGGEAVDRFVDAEDRFEARWTVHLPFHPKIYASPNDWHRLTSPSHEEGYWLLQDCPELSCFALGYWEVATVFTGDLEALTSSEGNFADCTPAAAPESLPMVYRPEEAPIVISPETQIYRILR